MINHDLEQGTEKWHAFRRMHIMATDAGVILRLNPYKTRTQLYREKMMGEKSDMNAAMAEGIRLEPIAREMFEGLHGIKVWPKVVSHDKLDWMAASLDGEGDKTLVEIKCGKGAHSKAKKNKIPEYYNAQMQHQMYVTGYHMMYYVCLWESELICIDVYRDVKFIENMIEKELEFKYLLDNFILPQD